MKKNNTVLLLGGSGSVGSVVLHTLCEKMRNVFGGRIIAASRDLSRYEKIKPRLSRQIELVEVDASNYLQLLKTMLGIKPNILINAGLPYYNLNAMEAALIAGVHYIDSACWEPPPGGDPVDAFYRHAEQWQLHAKFVKAGLTAVIGCGFDPGVSNAMVAEVIRLFPQVRDLKIDILDCNGGDHGQAFASNFNPVINLCELLGQVKYWQNGQWVYTAGLTQRDALHQSFEFEEIGGREMYLGYHEELESLTRNFPGIKRLRFWMTFSPQYLKYLRVFKELGLTSMRRLTVPGSISPLGFLKRIGNKGFTLDMYESLLKPVGLLSEQAVSLGQGEVQIAPLEFLQKVLPDPASLGKGYVGKTNIGIIARGIDKDNEPFAYRIFNVCDHTKSFRQTGGNAIAFTTGIPLAVGAWLIQNNRWRKPGVYNVEQLDASALITQIQQYGLPIYRRFSDDVPIMAA